MFDFKVALLWYHGNVEPLGIRGKLPLKILYYLYTIIPKNFSKMESLLIKVIGLSIYKSLNI